MELLLKSDTDAAFDSWKEINSLDSNISALQTIREYCSFPVYKIVNDGELQVSMYQLPRHHTLLLLDESVHYQLAISFQAQVQIVFLGCACLRSLSLWRSVR